MSQNQKDKDECGPPCAINAGVSMAFHICKQANVHCRDIEEELFDQKITVKEGMDKIKDRLRKDGEPFQVELVEEVEGVMKEEIEKAEAKEADTLQTPMPETECVSIFVKEKMKEKLEEWIEDRKEALKETQPDSPYADGTRELIFNLEQSKRTIEKLEACEE